MEQPEATNSYRLLFKSDYERLPKSPEAKFAVLEEIARNRLLEILSKTEDQNYFNTTARSTYIGTMDGLIGRLKLGSVSFLGSANNSGDFDKYIQKITALSTSCLMASAEEIGVDEMSLSQKARLRIENSEHLLREAILNSNRSEKEKLRLNSILDDLISTLRGTKSVSAQWAASRIMLIVSAVGGITAFLAAAPLAAETVSNTVNYLFQEAFDGEMELAISTERQLLLPAAPNKLDDKSDRLVPGSISENELPPPEPDTFDQVQIKSNRLSQ